MFEGRIEKMAVLRISNRRGLCVFVGCRQLSPVNLGICGLEANS
jgi:hypothetical protein